jgi:hypothetical protein
MAISGHVLDGQFAAGMLAVLSNELQIVFGSSGHWRPKADLGRPWGKVTGDFCCCFSRPGSSGYSLLIIEREGSAPGNERNILKWFQAIRLRAAISMDDGRQRIELTPDRIVLGLAFVRPGGWDLSDFDKTVAFCELLAEIVNTQCSDNQPSFSVVVERYGQLLDCCETCGRDMAHIILSRL